MMRDALFLIVLLSGCLLPCAVNATARQGDVIVVDGEEWNLLAAPMEMDSAVYHALLAYLPEERIWSTANWDGYVVHWTVRNGRLCLEKVEVKLPDTDGGMGMTVYYRPEELKQVFGRYCADDVVYAGWLTGELRLGREKVLWNAHTGFERHYEEECVMRLERGVVTASRHYRNFKREGIGLEEALDAFHERFPWADYPELQMVKSVTLEMYDFKVSADGRLQDCKMAASVTGYRSMDDVPWPDGANVPWIGVLKDFFCSLYPWRVIHINGNDYMYAPGLLMSNLCRGEQCGEGSRAFFPAY